MYASYPKRETSTCRSSTINSKQSQPNQNKCKLSHQFKTLTIQEHHDEGGTSPKITCNIYLFFFGSKPVIVNKWYLNPQPVKWGKQLSNQASEERQCLKKENKELGKAKQEAVEKKKKEEGR